MTAPDQVTFVSLADGDQLQFAINPGLPGDLDWTKELFIKYQGKAILRHGIRKVSLPPDTLVVPAKYHGPYEHLTPVLGPLSFRAWVQRLHEWAMLQELARKHPEPLGPNALWQVCERDIARLLRSRGRFNAALIKLQDSQLLVRVG